MGSMAEEPQRWMPHPQRPYRPMIIGVALTGAVPGKGDNPAVPVTPDEIVADIIECADAGAVTFHVHVRDDDGRPVHDAEAYAEIFATVRAKRPELILCGTTSARVGGELSSRMTCLDLAGACRPELASLTLGSANFPRTANVNPPNEMVALLERMAEVGVVPELEVFERGMVNTLHVLAGKGLIPDPPIVNILLGMNGAAPAFVGDLALLVDSLPADAEWAAAGIGMFQRPMVVAAALLGGNVRTGIEDNPRGHGTLPWTNADAVAFAVEAATVVGRPVATPDECRQRFGLADPMP
jgi:3-keto-5-aminohexanoate cleavage enzyme